MQIGAEWICFDIPFLIQADDSIEGNEHARFQPCQNDIPAEIRIKKKATEHPSGKMAGLVEGDRLGNVSQTRIQVGFDHQFLSTIPDEQNVDFEAVKDDDYMQKMPELEGRDGYLIESAVSYLNRFLEVYRTELDRYWIRDLLPEEIVYFTLFSVAENGEENRRIRWYSGGTLIPISATLGREDCENLNEILEAEEQIPVHIELDLATRDKIDLREYDLAVINAATLFEAWVKKAIKTVLFAEGLTETDVENQFKRGEDDYRSITDIAKKVVPRALHIKFEDTDEYRAWKKDTRELRNDVVHEGHRPSKTEAERAYTASKNAVEYLEEKVDERLAELEG